MLFITTPYNKGQQHIWHTLGKRKTKGIKKTKDWENTKNHDELLFSLNQVLKDILLIKTMSGFNRYRFFLQSQLKFQSLKFQHPPQEVTVNVNDYISEFSAQIYFSEVKIFLTSPYCFLSDFYSLQLSRNLIKILVYFLFVCQHFQNKPVDHLLPDIKINYRILGVMVHTE